MDLSHFSSGAWLLLNLKDFVLNTQNKVRQLTLESTALMGAGEEGTSAKSSKPASSSQEVPMMPIYPDWSGSMQAFYGAGATPPFFAPTVASPTPHPYMWGSQHPIMPHYGTPVPYPGLYPPGGVYAHPNMSMESRSADPMNPGTLHGTAELDGKATEREDHASSKKIKGASGNHGCRKTGDGRKAASCSGNDVGTQSAESESEGSSDASDDNNIQEFSATKKRSFDQMLADAANAQNHAFPANFQTSVPGNPVGSMNPTNINMGMDLWSSSSSGAEAMKLGSNPPGVSSIVTPSGMMNDQWVQDEREIKRQKRKQSNRESARRSRLRKQAECEELQQRVELLSNENHTIRDELQKLSEECEKLTAENNSIKEELTTLYGPDAVSKLENSNCSTIHVQSHQDEDNNKHWP